ncbi:MAG: hypothetical protein ACLGIN_08020 [Candidatus Sericytochromatia bacterium]
MAERRSDLPTVSRLLPLLAVLLALYLLFVVSGSVVAQTRANPRLPLVLRPLIA